MASISIAPGEVHVLLAREQQLRRASRRAPGRRPAGAPARPRAAQPSSSTTSVASPMRQRPLRVDLVAEHEQLASRGRARRGAAAGTPSPCRRPTSPTRVNRNANVAERGQQPEVARQRDHGARAGARPVDRRRSPAAGSRAAPLTTAPVMRVNSSSSAASILCSSPMISSTSPPEQNPRPSPVMHEHARVAAVRQLGDEVAQVGVRLERQRVELVGPRQRRQSPTPSATSSEKCSQRSVKGAEARNGLMSGSLLRRAPGSGR